jgi:hypothetical protein
MLREAFSQAGIDIYRAQHWRKRPPGSGTWYEKQPIFPMTNRDVVLWALCPNSLFSNFLSQNNPLDLVRFYENL